MLVKSGHHSFDSAAGSQNFEKSLNFLVMFAVKLPFQESSKRLQNANIWCRSSVHQLGKAVNHLN